VSPSYLARIIEGEAYNREPHKSEEVRWFGLDDLPEKLTMTAKNAINAYRGLPGAAAETGDGNTTPLK
jgi:hypothetical protein